MIFAEVSFWVRNGAPQVRSPRKSRVNLYRRLPLLVPSEAQKDQRRPLVTTEEAHGAHTHDHKIVSTVPQPVREITIFILAHVFIPFTVFAHLSPAPFLIETQIRGHRVGSSPPRPPTPSYVRLIFARRDKYFLPSSTRAELSHHHKVRRARSAHPFEEVPATRVRRTKRRNSPRGDVLRYNFSAAAAVCGHACIGATNRGGGGLDDTRIDCGIR